MTILMEAHLWRYTVYRAGLNLIAEASRYYLGWLWWLLEPLAMTGVFFVVFTYLRPSAMEGFTNFLIVGVTMWVWFANGVGNAADTLAGARGLISQMRLPKLLFPAIAVMSATVKQGFVFAIVLVFLGSVHGVALSWVTLPLLAFTQFTLTLAAAATVAFACCWVRDLRFIVRSGLTLTMFCSGLFYSIDSLPANWQALFRLNPMAVMIEQYRAVMLAGAAPDLLWCAKVIVGSGLWLLALKWIYARFDLQLTRKVIA